MDYAGDGVLEEELDYDDEDELDLGLGPAGEGGTGDGQGDPYAAGDEDEDELNDLYSDVDMYASLGRAENGSATAGTSQEQSGAKGEDRGPVNQAAAQVSAEPDREIKQEHPRPVAVKVEALSAPALGSATAPANGRLQDAGEATSTVGDRQGSGAAAAAAPPGAPASAAAKEAAGAASAYLAKHTSDAGDKKPVPSGAGQVGSAAGGVTDGTMLFVGELHWWTNDAELEVALSEFGRVKEIKFFEEKASGKSKGYCQVPPKLLFGLV